MNQFIYEKGSDGLTLFDIQSTVKQSICNAWKKVLILAPDFTRYHSNAGLITNLYYHFLTAQGCQVDILIALGTHDPITKADAAKMYGDIPYTKFIPHNWHSDVVSLGKIPAKYLQDLTQGLWCEPINIEINRRLLDKSYDQIISIGQVVPHEVIGMSNHSKNLLVGAGGSDLINKSHMIGALWGMERIMGRDFSPVRQLFDYAAEHFLKTIPILYVLTVCTASHENICTHGLFLGNDRGCLSAAIKLAQKKNITFLEHGIKKCVVYLPPEEFKSTWLGNKAIYRTRMAIADGGELIILAPGVQKFGEDSQCDKLIRAYGYCGRARLTALFNDPAHPELRSNMGTTAHLIHGSPDGRFTVTYAVKQMSQKEILQVGFQAADYNETIQKYRPEMLHYGYNTLPNGEKIYFIPNPALGLWINREKFQAESSSVCC